MSFFVLAPMVNVNEEEATLVEWFKSAGDFVHIGEILCALETTKSTFDLNVEQEGFFVPIVSSGETVKTGQVIAVLTNTKDEHFEMPESPSIESSPATHDPAQDARRWTKKAEIVAQRHQIPMEAVVKIHPNQKMITEQHVIDYIANTTEQQQQSAERRSCSQNQNANQRILILGAGNAAVLVLDILTRTPNQTAIGIVDDNPQMHEKQVMGIPVLGNLGLVVSLWNQNLFDMAALAVGALPARAEIYQRFKAQGIPFANIIDPTAVIGSESIMGEGNMVMAFCRLGPESTIGDNNFLSAYVNIEHHNVLGNHCTFGPSVFMSGGVHVGSHVRFGTGIAVEPRLTIGDHSVIASGVILTTHVPANTIVRNKTNFSFHDRHS